MPTFSIDNDRVTAGIQDLHYDQTSGVQSPPDGDDADVTLVNVNELDGLGADFRAFLATLSLSADQLNYAIDADGALSNSDFIKVTADPGEMLNDLKLIANSSTALTSFQTLAGESLYVHVDASGNYASIWTSSDNSGRIVGAIALTNETIDNLTTHTATAGVAMVFFEAIKQTDTNSQDESVSLSDVLDVGVDTAVTFSFDNLDSGNFLYAAFGTTAAGIVITGEDLNVNDSLKGNGSPSVNFGKPVSGGADPCDTINTGQGGDGATMGVNAQDIRAGGGNMVVTLVTGFIPLTGITDGSTFGDDVRDILYDQYINTNSASIFLSQMVSNDAGALTVSLWEAGGNNNAGEDPTDNAPGSLVAEEGYGPIPNPAGDNTGYIGDDDNDTQLKNDWPVEVASVTITRGGVDYTWTSAGGAPGSPPSYKGVELDVTFDGNAFTVVGLAGFDKITFTAANDLNDPLDGTFNRFKIEGVAGNVDIGAISLSQGGLTTEDLGTHLFADDDGPSIDPSDDVSKPNDLQVDNDLSDAADSSDDSFFILDSGTDGLLSYKIVGPADNSGDFQWTYDDSSQTAITGTYKGSDLYTLVLNSDGSYDFDMIGTLPGSTLDLSPAEVIKAGSPDSPILEIGAAQNDDFVRMSADSTVGNGNINESHGFVGCDNGNLDAGESLTFTLHEADGDPLTFQGIQIGTKSAQGGVYNWEAHVVGGGTLTGQETVVKNGVIDISALDLGGATIDSITITKVSGPATKIGIGDIHIIIQPNDVQLGFTVELKDGDNDPVTASFVVDIDADNDGDFEANVNALSLPIQEGNEFSALSMFETHDDFALI